MSDILDTSKQVNNVCLSLLLQEIVPTSTRVTQRLADKSFKQPDDIQTRINTRLSDFEDDTPGRISIFDSELVSSEKVSLRVEAFGFDLGLRLTEVMMYKSSNHSKIVDILEIMKFICRDIWKSLHGKQMDNLRTNHRGTFVLIDNNYRLISGFDSVKGKADSITKAQIYTSFPCGVIRGILLSFGIDSYVSAELSQFPAVTFNIQTTINN